MCMLYGCGPFLSSDVYVVWVWPLYQFLMCMMYGCGPFLRLMCMLYGCGPSLDMMYMLILGMTLLGYDVYVEFWVQPFLDLICMLIWVRLFLDLICMLIWVCLFLGYEFMVSLGSTLVSCWVLSTTPFRTIHLHSFHFLCL
jgi:hypothetical protein